jgi:hypothetical protein
VRSLFNSTLGLRRSIKRKNEKKKEKEKVAQAATGWPDKRFTVGTM